MWCFFLFFFSWGLKRPHKKKRNNKGGGGKAKGNARKSFPGPENKMELHKKKKQEKYTKNSVLRNTVALLCHWFLYFASCSHTKRVKKQLKRG